MPLRKLVPGLGLLLVTFKTSWRRLSACTVGHWPPPRRNPASWMWCRCFSPDSTTMVCVLVSINNGSRHLLPNTMHLPVSGSTGVNISFLSFLVTCYERSPLGYGPQFCSIGSQPPLTQFFSLGSSRAPGVRELMGVVIFFWIRELLGCYVLLDFRDTITQTLFSQTTCACVCFHVLAHCIHLKTRTC